MSQQWQVLEDAYQLGGITIKRNPRDGFGFQWRVQHQGTEIKRCKDLQDAMTYGEQLAERIVGRGD